MYTHSRVPCLENPMDRGAWWAAVKSMGSQRIGHDCVTEQQLMQRGEVIFKVAQLSSQSVAYSLGLVSALSPHLFNKNKQQFIEFLSDQNEISESLFNWPELQM